MSETRCVRSVRREGDAVVADFDLGHGAATFSNSYAMAPDGSVVVTGEFRPVRTDLPPSVRIGLAFALPTDTGTVE